MQAIVESMSVSVLGLGMYVPVQTAYRDIVSTICFFTGSISTWVLVRVR